jgi:dTDP-4-dehydrorhamnose 3,5-epimerase
VIFAPTPLAGLTVVRPEPLPDVRGSFARLWCDDAFAAAGLAFRPRQISASRNTASGTLRGLHWQAPPSAETKLVRATHGRVFDVAVDLREGSPTRLRWFGLELDAVAQTALLIPAGFAHGYLTLTPEAELLYLIDTPHEPAAARGARYDDPAIGITWPHPPAVIAPRDLAFPPL